MSNERNIHDAFIEEVDEKFGIVGDAVNYESIGKLYARSKVLEAAIVLSSPPIPMNTILAIEQISEFLHINQRWLSGSKGKKVGRGLRIVNGGLQAIRDLKRHSLS